MQVASAFTELVVWEAVAVTMVPAVAVMTLSTESIKYIVPLEFVRVLTFMVAGRVEVG